MSDTLLLVDAYSLIYRAFYAIRNLTNPQGEPVNAVFGFTKMLRKLRADYHPTHWAVVFDLGAPRQRLTLLPSYKQQRPSTPPDLESQLPAIREILQAWNVAIVEQEGEEADDLIGTLAVRGAQAGLRVFIASSDKDFTQLVDERIVLIGPAEKDGAVMDVAAVQAKYGLHPNQMVDFFSLTGDAVDNIPGLTGVGPKTAQELLQRYQNLEGVLRHAAEITRPKLRATLEGGTTQAQLNRSLVQLMTDLPLPIELPALKVRPPDAPRLLAALRSHGFKSLLAEVEQEIAATGDLFAGR